jgi:hypothetical protein
MARATTRFPPFADKLYYSDYKAWVAMHDKFVAKWKNAFWLAHRAYGSNAKAFFGDVYALPKELGMFDVTIVGALLERLADPIKALASIAKLTRSTLVINSEVIDSNDKFARFNGDATKPQFDYVFWTYSMGVYREVLKMLGFQNIADRQR